MARMTPISYTLEDALLTHAANADYADVLRCLASGANATATDALGNNALHYIATSVHSEAIGIVSELLKKGCSPLQKNKDGKTPIDLAFSADVPDRLVIFFEKEPALLDNLPQQRMEALALMLVQETKNRECATSPLTYKTMIALSKHIDLSTLTQNGETLLTQALRHDCWAVTQALINLQIDTETPNLQGEKPIAECARRGLWSVVEPLCDAGVRLDARDATGRTLDQILHEDPRPAADRKAALQTAFHKARLKQARQLLSKSRVMKP